MHIYNLEKWKCGIEPGIDNSSAEKKTWFVIILTLATMVAEITAGTIFGSMALLADGWHMGTHAAALGIAAFAYWYARKQKDNPKFTFGTGKVAEEIIEAVAGLILQLRLGFKVQRFKVQGYSILDFRFNKMPDLNRPRPRLRIE